MIFLYKKPQCIFELPQIVQTVQKTLIDVEN